jgi:hypothetical protein
MAYAITEPATFTTLIFGEHINTHYKQLGFMVNNMQRLAIAKIIFLASCLTFTPDSIACDDIFAKQNKIESLFLSKDYAGVNAVEFSKADREQNQIECIDSVVDILEMKSLAHAKLNENSLAKENILDAIKTLQPIEAITFDGYKKEFTLGIIFQSIEFKLDYQHAIAYSNELLERMTNFIHDKSKIKKYPMFWQYKEMHAVASNIYAHNLIKKDDCAHALQVIAASEIILPQIEVQRFQVGLEREKLKNLCF